LYFDCMKVASRSTEIEKRPFPSHMYQQQEVYSCEVSISPRVKHVSTHPFLEPPSLAHCPQTTVEPIMHCSRIKIHVPVAIVLSKALRAGQVSRFAEQLPGNTTETGWTQSAKPFVKSSAAANEAGRGGLVGCVRSEFVHGDSSRNRAPRSDELAFGRALRVI
jgi:hypothetical protein